MSEEEIRLDQTKKVFDTLADLISKNETCSYRYLIYDLLDFDMKDYATLISGLTITNALVDKEQKENIIKEVREYMNKHEIEEVYLDCKLYETKVYKDILEILDKGENNVEI